jgi:hypothetical protein
MKKAQYSMMSRGRIDGMSGLSTALLSGGGSSSLRSLWLRLLSGKEGASISAVVYLGLASF